MRYAFALLLLAGAPHQAAWDERQALALLDEYFKPGADRTALAERLEALDALPAAKVKRVCDHLARRLREGPKSKPDGQGLCTLQHPTEKGTYFLAGADSRSRTPQAVVIALHGGSPGLEGNKSLPAASGREAMRAWNPAGTPLAGAIVIGPNQPPERERAWTHDGGMRFVVACLEEVARTFAIDVARIYVVGHSLGGFGSWNIGSLAPDLFAGAAGGGCTPYGTVENLRVLPCWQYWGLDDPHTEYKGYHERFTKRLEELKREHGGYDHILKSYESIGHGFPPEGHGPIFKWLAEKRRDAAPRKFVWKPGAGRDGAYWIDGAAGPVVAEQAGRNLFELRGRAASILLHEKMADLKQDVIVRVDGAEAFRGKAAPSLVAIVRSFERWREAVFTARVRLA